MKQIIRITKPETLVYIGGADVKADGFFKLNCERGKLTIGPINEAILKEWAAVPVKLIGPEGGCAFCFNERIVEAVNRIFDAGTAEQGDIIEMVDSQTALERLTAAKVPRGTFSDESVEVDEYGVEV